MGRPRKNPVPETISSEPLTEQVIAPVTLAPVYRAPAQPMPRQKQVERQGSRSEPYTKRYPQVRGGTCEYCGVLDPNTPAQYQYKLCPHYRGMQLQCSYCPAQKDPDDVIYHTNLNIADSPDGQSLIVWCDSYECSRAHEQRFKRNAQ